jgi:hypothetical protein
VDDNVVGGVISSVVVEPGEMVVVVTLTTRTGLAARVFTQNTVPFLR